MLSLCEEKKSRGDICVKRRGKKKKEGRKIAGDVSTNFSSGKKHSAADDSRIVFF